MLHRHCYGEVLRELKLGELQEIRNRVGIHNLFNETAAVGFYELDLADPRDNWCGSRYYV